MEMLTVKDAADLKGCSERYVRMLIQQGKILAEVSLTPNNIKQYLIPFSTLPEELKTKYYKQKKLGAVISPEIKHTKPPRSFDCQGQLKNAQKRALNFVQKRRFKLKLFQTKCWLLALFVS